MGKFSFRLDNVLRIREREEKIAYEKLAAEQAVLTQIEERITLLDEELKGIQENFSSRQKQALSPQEFQANLNYFQKLQGDLTRLQDDMLAAQVKVGKQRQVLTAASKNKKVLEKLKEKKKDEWIKKMDKFEAESLDEISIQRYKQES